ncbi:cellulose biosynthesis protein BcsN [Acuticoccus sp. M5D2P5]|uniref:cellulose biosynthesis protein BcsN n=1 Tax=Acuticoccus kalidii TaxID=2910977 RepID=UPI001F47D361|nr:cellulose biosynthesis protein BcsN [Acuticoccus kalidii]MCF3931935.1 cellulose biosynthesis protein BcsN [Acuticoccus kalidii]
MRLDAMILTLRKAHQTIAILISAALAGCGYNAGGVRTATLGNSVPVTEAFMTPPPGGPEVIAVVENRYANALAQDIILDNGSSVSGQNVIYVRAFGPMGRDAGQSTLSTDLMNVTDIRQELNERFPGVPMRVSGLYAQNRYGPFSYATGGSGKATCIYAWQRIAADARVFSFQRGAITWRLRLCENNTDARSLLLLAYGLTINGYFMSKTWNPYGDPPEPDPRIGRPGETILPEQVVDPTVIAPTSYREPQRTTIKRPAPSRASRPASAPVPVRPQVLNEPVEGAAVVPRPEQTDLSEPAVGTSNLPSNSPAPPPTYTVPSPSTSLRPSAPPASTTPTVAPPPSGPRLVMPPTSASASPAVRVVNMR